MLMATGMENLDPESRTILERAMSMESAAMAMGLDPVRRREQQQLAEDMERKNSEARRRRAAAIMGEQKVPDAAPKQAPVKRRKGFAQQPSTVRQEMPVITPVQPLPPDPAETQEQGVDNTAMRNVFAKLSGKPISRPATLAPVAEPVVGEPANEAVEEAPAPAETPEVHVVHEQELVDRPFDFNTDVPDFDAFTRISRLPSQGLFYPNELLGQSLKLIDNYALDDINDGTANTRTALNSILRRRIRGIDPQDILTCDETYILHWLRASSFPEHGMIHPGYVCPHCEFDTSEDENPFHDYRIGFRQLKFTLSKDIRQVYELHRTNGYHTGFIGDGREFHVYIHRLRHATLLNDFIIDWEDENDIAIPTYMRNIAGIATVVEIEGIDNADDDERMKAKVKYISELPRKYRKDFENLVVEGTVNCKITAVTNCVNCGGVVETPYPFLIPGFISGL